VYEYKKVFLNDVLYYRETPRKGCKPQTPGINYRNVNDLKNTRPYNPDLAKEETSRGCPLMRHDSAVINLWVAVVANLTVLVVKDDSLIALLNVVLASIIGTSIHKWELVAAVIIGRTVLWEGEFHAFGVIVGERMWVLIS
jgi:hypothetical protein